MREVTYIGKRVSTWVALAVLATIGVMLGPDSASAKVDVDKLTISGEARIRYEYRVGATFGSSLANESAGSHRIRVGVGYDLTPDVAFFAQISDARLYGSECGSPTGGSGAGCVGASGVFSVHSANNNGSGVDLHQGHILVKNILTPGLSAKIGRQEIIFGDQRLIGNFGWSQIGIAFDAVRLTHSTPFADVDLFWARVIDSEATGANNGVIFPAAGTKGTTDQDLYGAYITLKPLESWTVEPYYFLLKDSRAPLAAVAGGAGISGTPQAPDQARNFLGGRINGKAGGLDATGEAVWQFGGISAAGAPDHNLHMNAHAEVLRAGYTFEAVPMKPRIGFEFLYASGDDCVNKGTCVTVGHFNTADNLFPTNHGTFGYMDLQAWRNEVIYRVTADVKPDPVSKVRVDFLIHRLARTTDNWYRASQTIYATPLPGNQAASLGQELNLHYFRTFKEKFKLEIGYGRFFAGEFLHKANPTSVNGPRSTTTFNQDSDQNWGYVMGSVLF